MKKIFAKIYPLVLLPMIAACVQIKDKDKHDKPAPLDHYIEATATPNEFRVHLSPAGEGCEIRRQNFSENQLRATAVSLDSGLVDAHVTPGNKYRYEYVSRSGDIVKVVEVQIPLDLVIDREISLAQSPEWQNIYRLYFLSGGILTTNGNHVLLKAQMLFSDHGVIRTFPEGATANAEAMGRSGGEIRIFAKKASGDLAIELRGENGGAGDAKNADGRPGGDSGNFYYDSPSNRLRITHLIQAGVGGAGAKAVLGSATCPMGNCHAGEFITTPGRPAGPRGTDGQGGEICLAQNGRLLSCEQ